LGHGSRRGSGREAWGSSAFRRWRGREAAGTAGRRGQGRASGRLVSDRRSDGSAARGWRGRKAAALWGRRGRRHATGPGRQGWRGHGSLRGHGWRSRWLRRGSRRRYRPSRAGGLTVPPGERRTRAIAALSRVLLHRLVDEVIDGAFELARHLLKRVPQDVSALKGAGAFLVRITHGCALIVPPSRVCVKLFPEGVPALQPIARYPCRLSSSWRDLRPDP
jgi:hypothetical protein